MRAPVEAVDDEIGLLVQLVRQPLGRNPTGYGHVILSADGRELTAFLAKRPLHGADDVVTLPEPLQDGLGVRPQLPASTAELLGKAKGLKVLQAAGEEGTLAEPTELLGRNSHSLGGFASRRPQQRVIPCRMRCVTNVDRANCGATRTKSRTSTSTLAKYYRWTRRWMGWRMGFEPTTTGITIRDSTS